MTDDSLLKKGLGGLGNLGKQLAKGAADQTKKTVKTAASQVGFEHLTNQEKAGAAPAQAEQRAKDNEDIVKALYGKSDAAPVQNSEPIQQPSQGQDNKQQNQSDKLTQGQQVAQSIAEKHPEMTPEEVQKMASLRSQLHQEYYQKLVNPPKQQEERPVEKLEREENEKRWELHEKEKKKPKNLAVDNEQHKAERRTGSG